MKKLLFLLAIPLGIFLASVLHTGSAHATPFAEPEFTGYFNGGPYIRPGHNLFGPPGGVDMYGTVNNIDAFVNLYRTNLWSGDPKLTVGAGFTVLTMMGYPPRTPLSTAQAVFPQWEALVRYYDSQGWIQWYQNYSYTTNTLFYYEPGTWGDIAWYNDAASAMSIVFYNPDDGTTYAIKRDCANPVGIATLHYKNTSVSCGSAVVSPSNPEPGDALTVKVTVTYSGGPPGSPTLANGSIKVDAGDVGVAAGYPSVSGNTVTMVSNAFTKAAGHYVVSWKVDVNGVTASCGGNLALATDTFDVFNYPYVDVRNGDLVAGAKFATTPGGSCGGSNPNAGIASWNKGPGGYAGAGTQYSASAMSVIQGLITNRGNSNGAGTSSLAFAANGANGTTLFGGSFGNGPCVDAWSKNPGGAVASPGTINLNSMSGTHVYNGNLTINANPGASRIPAGTKLTIYVDGNVNIHASGGGTKGIMYGGTPSPNVASWASVSDIPSFKLIVHGNIYIDSTIDQLDGTYIAVPDSGYDLPGYNSAYAAPRNGTIATCTSGFTVLSPATAPVNALVAACMHPLIINGSFAANQVWFLRTYGTMSGAPAEHFNSDAESWLVPSDSGTLDPNYQSIIGLPPVL